MKMDESEEDCYGVALRYKKMRKKLDNLGYKDVISVETLPLVEKLLGDLIKTTESLKHFKSIAENNIENCNSSHLFDYNNSCKCDNSKLSVECNKLQTELIESKDNYLKQTKELKRKLERLENDCSDLQLASSRNLKRIKDLELESSNKSKRIQELLGKCCKPTVSNVGLGSKRKSVYPLKKPIIEGEFLPQDSNKNLINYPSLSKIEPHIVDLVRMADKKINALNHEVIKLKGESTVYIDDIYTLKSQLAMKEKEICRLRKMLESGRSINSNCTCRPNDKLCVECNFSARNMNEVKVLQQAKLNLEQQLKDALDKQHDAMSQAMKLAERNEELEKELHDIDHIAMAVEANCDSTVKENNRRVNQLKEKLENTVAQLGELENDLLVEKRTCQELRADLEGCKLEKRNMQRALESALDDNKKLSDRLSDLNIIEEDLNNEIDRLSRLNQDQKYEISELKFVNESLKKQLNDISETAKNNQGKLSRFGSHKHSSTSSESISETRKIISEKEDKIRQLERIIHRIESERDHYKEEYNKIKGSKNQSADLWSQICDLKHQLNEKELKISELQRDKNELAREKYDLESKLKSKNYNASVLISSNNSASESGSSKVTLSRLERERDSVKSDLKHVAEERDILHERLKLATEAHTTEQRRLRERIRDLENKLNEMESEKHDILQSQGSRRSAMSGLEQQFDSTKEELRRTKQELAAQRTQYFQLRALQDQTDQALGDVQSQLNQTELELTKAIERNRDLEQQQLQLNNQVKELKEEINTLRSNMAHLDREKDQLMIEIDKKTEKIASLEREIHLKEQQAIGVEKQHRDLQRKNQICIDKTAEQERLFRNLQMEIENYQRQLAASSSDRDKLTMENHKLQDDLAALTCEIRTLQSELKNSQAESYDLKKQLQTYVSEVRRAEELLNRKENERTEMLNHFRSLSLEATVLENNNHSLESQVSETRNALQTTRDRLLDLERQLADKDCLIRGYENQISELTQTVASLEMQITQQREQRCQIESDLNALRQLCVKLDEEKQKLGRKVDDLACINNQYESQISRLKRDQNIIQNKMECDEVAVNRFQILLDNSRRELLDNERENQELQNEIQRLKQKINELESKLSAESADLRRYQNQVADYSKQISELKRRVTDERFERARTEEQHRRSHQNSGDSHLGNISNDPVRINTRSHRSPPSNRFAVMDNISQDFCTNSTCPVQKNRDKVSKILNKDVEVEKDKMNKTQPLINLCGHGDISINAVVEEYQKYKDIRVEIKKKPDKKTMCSSVNSKSDLIRGQSTSEKVNNTDEEPVVIPIFRKRQDLKSKVSNTTVTSINKSHDSIKYISSDDERELIRKVIKNNGKPCGCPFDKQLVNCPGKRKMNSVKNKQTNPNYFKKQLNVINEILKNEMTASQLNENVNSNSNKSKRILPQIIVEDYDELLMKEANKNTAHSDNDR